MTESKTLLSKRQRLLSAKTAKELIETRSFLSPNLALEIRTIEEQYLYIDYLEVWDGKLPQVIIGKGGIINPLP